jgi:hypothetical protein
MSKMPQDIEKQKALYACLKPQLNHTQLMEAMMLWQDKYAAIPGFSVRYFADDVAKISDNTITPKQLVLSMVAALTSNVGTRLDPSVEIERYRLQHNKVTNFPASPYIEAFSVLVKKIFSLTPDADSKSIKSTLHADILARKENSDSAHLDVHFLKWLKNDGHLLRPAFVTIEQLSTMVSLIYKLYCQHLGPVKTDALFAEALKRLETNGGAIYTDIFKKLL